ncbi:MAG: hypothetical protein JXB88_01305, partial [Spirochaetales bacterium]|nr:hypothetical protein [Spirochaetales bacterium]
PYIKEVKFLPALLFYQKKYFFSVSNTCFNKNTPIMGMIYERRIAHKFASPLEIYSLSWYISPVTNNPGKRPCFYHSNYPVSIRCHGLCGIDRAGCRRIP